MKSYQVKNLMVPLSEYSTIPQDDSLLEAFMMLKKAQADFDPGRGRRRAILVTDNDNHVVGKLSQHDMIEALEPSYQNIRSSLQDGRMHRLGFSDDFVESTLEQYQLWEQGLENLCAKSGQITVKEIMYSPSEGEFLSESSTMNRAIHRLVIGHHHSLLVTAEGDPHEIVGVLRLEDVFDFVCDVLKGRKE
jgi:CBS domain-containing protein